MLTDPSVRVVLAAIRDDRNRILLTRRHADAHQGGLWELPGGKLETGESAFAGLQREIREELGLAIETAVPLIRIRHDYPDRRVMLDVQETRDWSGTPRGREAQPLRWVEPRELNGLAFPAANRPVLKALQLPDHYLITPEPDDSEAFLQSLQRALAGGIRLVQLRSRQSPSEALIAAAIELCHRHAARILLNTPALTVPAAADGIHLTADRLAQLSARPLSADKWVAASCHSVAELSRAAALGVDFCVLGPVQATATHPDASPLGWPGFAAACERAGLPVYALGGMIADDVIRAREHGGQGIAAIRGLWPEAV